MLIQALVGRMRRTNRPAADLSASRNDLGFVWHTLPPSAPRGTDEIYRVRH